jgi:hypothetical protein
LDFCLGIASPMPSRLVTNGGAVPGAGAVPTSALRGATVPLSSSADAAARRLPAR